MTHNDSISRELQSIRSEKLPDVEPALLHEMIKGIRLKTVLESAERFGTPQYLLDQDLLRQRARFFRDTFRRLLPTADFFYPFKCNDLPVLIRTLQEEGFQADVAGLHELQLAIKLGMGQVVFSSPGKSDEELRLALREKKHVILIIDNVDEIHRLHDLTRSRKLRFPIRVGLRIKTATTSGGIWGKFGFDLSSLGDALHLVRRNDNLSLTGLHFHCSWNRTPRNYCENIQLIGEFLASSCSREELRGIRFLDLGGGFYPEDQTTLHKGEDKGILLEMLAARGFDRKMLTEDMGCDPYAFSAIPVEPLPVFAEAIASALETHIFPILPDRLAIFFEPGRFIATHATTILVRVIAVKKTGVIVDGGINALGDYKFSEYSFSPIVNVTRPSMEMRRETIYGPLCDPNDLWGYSCFGDPPQTGDVLAVLHQGAYTFSTAWRFIKSIPAYIVASGDQLSVARRADTFHDRYGACRMPANMDNQPAE